MLHDLSGPAGKPQRSSREARTLVAEAASYIFYHKGPDEEGRAHPEHNISGKLLGEALESAKEMGLDPGWQVFHFPGTWGMYRDPAVVREVIRRKGDELLNSDPYCGNVTKLLSNVEFDEFVSPLHDEVDGRTVVVSMNRPVLQAGNTAYIAMKTWLEETGRAGEYRNFRPYHMNRASVGWAEDRNICEELIVKRFDSLLQAPPYCGDVLKLLTCAGSDEVFAPFPDGLNGDVVYISLAGLPEEYHNSMYNMVMTYVRAKGLEDFNDLRPYHLRDAKLSKPDAEEDNDGPNMSLLQEELLCRKLDLVLESEYEGDVVRMIREVPAEVLGTPFIDTVGEIQIEVSANVYKCVFGGRCHPMLSAYLRAKGLTQIADAFRPYHRLKADSGTWIDGNWKLEVAVKKLDSLLAGPRYGGDLVRLLTELTYEELAGPLEEDLGEKHISVSMTEAIAGLGGSTYDVLVAYLKHKNLWAEYSNYKPYHLQKSPNRTFRVEGDAQAYAEELLCRKCEQVIRDEFGGSSEDFAAGVSIQHLVTGFSDTLGGRPVHVSTWVLRKVYSSRDEMLEVFLRRGKGNNELLHPSRCSG